MVGTRASGSEKRSTAKCSAIDLNECIEALVLGSNEAANIDVIDESFIQPVQEIAVASKKRAGDEVVLCFGEGARGFATRLH